MTDWSEPQRAPTDLPAPDDSIEHDAPIVAVDQAVADAPRGGCGRQLALSIALPGLATIRRKPVLGLLLFVVGVALPSAVVAWGLASRDDLLELVFGRWFLTAVVAAGLIAVLARAVAVTEVGVAFRRQPHAGIKIGIAGLVTACLAAPVLFVVFYVNHARSTIATVFEADSPALFVAEPADTSDRQITNVLLLGGDAAPGGDGMHTASVILLSVDRSSGRTAVVSIPRDLAGLEFPPGSPLAGALPADYDDITNEVFTHLAERPEVVDEYGGTTEQAAAIALSQGVGYTLDVQIDDYAMSDQQGVQQLLDAVDELADLDADSSLGDAFNGFLTTTDEFNESLRTSVSAEQFGSMLDRFGPRLDVGESIGLDQPLIEPEQPDFAEIREIVDAVERYVATGEPSGYAD